MVAYVLFFLLFIVIIVVIVIYVSVAHMWNFKSNCSPGSSPGVAAPKAIII